MECDHRNPLKLLHQLQNNAFWPAEIAELVGVFIIVDIDKNVPALLLYRCHYILDVIHYKGQVLDAAGVHVGFFGRRLVCGMEKFGQL